MSANEHAEVLASVLAHDDDPGVADAPTREAFAVDTLERATWAVRKIAQHRRRFAEQAAVAAAEHARIDEWLASQRQRCEMSTGHLEALLRGYHEARLADDNDGFDPRQITAETWKLVKQSKTVRTPAGDLVARKQRDRIDVDEGVFVPWAEDHAPDLLNPPKPRTAAKAEIRKRVGEIMTDGTVVHEATGEFIPGVVHVDGTVSYSVETPEVDQ